MRNKKFLIFAVGAGFVLGIALGAVLFHRAGSGGGAASAGKVLYHCPMHPTYVSDKPGECPICGMTLVRADSGQAAPQGKKERKILFYRSPMNPSVTSPAPAKDAMGMDYVPVYEDEVNGAPAGPGVPGRAAVDIPEARQQLIGVRIGRVRKRPFIKEIRTAGRIAYDPQLYRAQEEYLAALSAYERVKEGGIAESVERSRSLVESSRLRLRLLGLSDSQIDRLSRSEGPDTSLLLSGNSGKVWLYADVYESELPLVKVGQVIEASSLSSPGAVFRGKIRAIDPVIDPKTRSARVRAEIENPQGILKPDMYLDARIKIDLGDRLTVPDSAVMDLETRRIVFVAKGNGFFEPREVLLGAKSEDYDEVKGGLSEGESVVTSGNFLVDSESNLKASLAAIAGGPSH